MPLRLPNKAIGLLHWPDAHSGTHACGPVAKAVTHVVQLVLHALQLWFYWSDLALSSTLHRLHKLRLVAFDRCERQHGDQHEQSCHRQAPGQARPLPWHVFIEAMAVAQELHLRVGGDLAHGTGGGLQDGATRRVSCDFLAARAVAAHGQGVPMNAAEIVLVSAFPKRWQHGVQDLRLQPRCRLRWSFRIGLRALPVNQSSLPPC
mmetsp:Transcript_49266/g.114179  ORF Transcript_49266/g.114179 Transcript_49266/m.114179 type:complete len:205 (-) Transcript_49266:644-1258(-)